MSISRVHVKGLALLLKFFSTTSRSEPSLAEKRRRLNTEKDAVAFSETRDLLGEP